MPGASRGRGGGQPVPILMYHQVTPKPTAAFAKYTVTAKAFAAQEHKVLPQVVDADAGRNQHQPVSR